MARKYDKAATIDPRGKPEAPTASVQKMREPGGQVSPDQLIHEIAKSKFVIRSFPIPGAKLAFPHEWACRCVDKYYPLAEGGPLFVDMPKLKEDEADCNKKRIFMQRAGFRYLVITKRTDLYDAQLQLAKAKPEAVA